MGYIFPIDFSFLKNSPVLYCFIKYILVNTKPQKKSVASAFIIASVSAATISALSLTFFAKYVVFFKPVISIINNYSLIETQVNKLPYVKVKGEKCHSFTLGFISL